MTLGLFGRPFTINQNRNHSTPASKWIYNVHVIKNLSCPREIGYLLFSPNTPGVRWTSHFRLTNFCVWTSDHFSFMRWEDGDLNVYFMIFTTTGRKKKLKKTLIRETDWLVVNETMLKYNFPIGIWTEEQESVVEFGVHVHVLIFSNQHYITRKFTMAM